MNDFPYLERFRAQVTPPPRPTFGTRPWDQVFTELGTELPPDFVAFVELYGDSAFGNQFLRVVDPRKEFQKSFAQRARETGDDYRRWREQFPESHQMAAWPEPGGFLSWGSNVDGDRFGWLTHGEPEHWPTAVWARHLDDGLIDEVPMTQFMYGWLTSPITYPDWFPPLPGLLEEEDLDENEEPLPHISRELTCLPEPVTGPA